MFRDYEELNYQITAHGLEAFREAIFNLVRPAVHMSRMQIDEQYLPLGTSKLGGNPDVPLDFEWFYWGEKPLTFMMQLKLSEVAQPRYEKYVPPATLPQQLTLPAMESIPIAPFPHTPEMLPQQGMLYFFYDADEIPFGETSERDGWQIFFIEDENIALERRPHPSATGVHRDIKALLCHHLSFFQRLSLPHFLDRATYEKLFKIVRDGEDYNHVAQRYFDCTAFRRPDKPAHYLYGHPLHIHDSVESACAYWSLNTEPDGHKFDFRRPKKHISNIELETEKWQFLFQIASDNSLHVMWGDGGILYICIPKKSLKARRFEDCWLIGQQH